VQRDELFLIEVKDFRGHRIVNQRRLTEGELAIEIGQKVKDSIAGLVGAGRTSNQLEAVADINRHLCNSEHAIKVIVWLELDFPDHLPKREKVRRSTEGNLFKQKLCWLTTKVFVTSIRDNALHLSGLTVRNLPHQP